MNALKTTVLLALMTGIFLAVGYSLGGQDGALLALILAGVMNIGSYWFSDKLVLRMYRAKKTDATLHPQLHRILQHLTTRSGLPMPAMYIIDLPVPNAFATGRNPKHAAIAVTKGLLEALNEEEVEGVIAHELAHVKNRDMLISTIAATLAGALSYIAQMAYYGALFGGGRDSENGNAAGSIALLMLSPLIATLLHLAVSRTREYNADETGAKMSGKPHALASALEKIHGFSKMHPLQAQPKYEATAHLFIMNPFKRSLLMSLFSTHPPVEERIRRLHALR